MRITVVGAGNSGLAMAGHLALNGHEVCLWNRSLTTIEKLIETHTIHCNGIITGDAKIDIVTDNMSVAVKNTELILVTTPANAHRNIAKLLAQCLEANIPIILNPGRTFGALEFVRVFEEEGVTHKPSVAETQTIIYTCRKLSSDSVIILAMKRDVLIYALEKNQTNILINLLPECIRSYFVSARNMMDTSIGNVGMILHCAPTLLNVGWIENAKTIFNYYYDGITPSIAELLEELDDERIEVSRLLGVPVESVAEWLRRTYDIQGKNLYECLQNNTAYKTIEAPKNLNHRYIYEDIPCGLVPLESIGKSLGLEMKVTKLVIDLACSMVRKNFRNEGRILENLSEKRQSPKEIIDFIIG